MKLIVRTVALGTLFGFLVGVAAAAPGVTERVSVSSAGAEADSSSEMAAISADGRFVAFASLASNLVENDTNGVADVFVRDRVNGTTERVSVSSKGREGDGHSGIVGVAGYPAISADGRFVAFPSEATKLVKKDRNGATDVFVHDRLTGTTERVSVSSAGDEANGFSEGPAISADGRFVAFQSNADNLAPEDGNLVDDVFVHDRVTGTTERVSVSSSGVGGNGTSSRPDISADGGFVVFHSNAENLVPGTPSSFFQVFLRDRATGTTERITEDAAGDPGDRNSLLPAVSADGRFVAFETVAGNLIGDGSHQGHVLVRDRATGTFERASVDSAGNAGNDFSGRPDITDDGRFVAFDSIATNLVAGDTNNRDDIFVRDRQAGTTERVSVSSTGAEANGPSARAKIAAGGAAVAFQSNADNLVAGDTSPTTDVFVHVR